MVKNFSVTAGYQNGHYVYRIVATERIAKMRSSDIIATCNSLEDAEWLCGVLECYWLLTNKIAHSIAREIKDVINN